MRAERTQCVMAGLETWGLRTRARRGPWEQDAGQSWPLGTDLLLPAPRPQPWSLLSSLGALLRVKVRDTALFGADKGGLMDATQPDSRCGHRHSHELACLVTSLTPNSKCRQRLLAGWREDWGWRHRAHHMAPHVVHGGQAGPPDLPPGLFYVDSTIAECPQSACLRLLEPSQWQSRGRHPRSTHGTLRLRE